MGVLGVFHPTITVSNMDQALTFYRDVLGLRPTFDGLHEPAALSRLLGYTEPEVAALAAEKTDEARIARMRELIEAMRTSTDDPDAYLDLDVAFHGELVAAADNRILSQLVDSIGDLLRASRRVTNLLPHALLSATEAHGAVLEAVIAGDPDAARAAMISHIEFAAAAWTAERKRTRKAASA